MKTTENQVNESEPGKRNPTASAREFLTAVVDFIMGENCPKCGFALREDAECCPVKAEAIAPSKECLIETANFIGKNLSALAVLESIGSMPRGSTERVRERVTPVQNYLYELAYGDAKKKEDHR